MKRSRNGSRRSENSDRPMQKGRLPLSNYDGPMPLGIGVGIPITNRSFKSRTHADYGLAAPYSSPIVCLEPYLLRMFVGLFKVPVGGTILPITYQGYRSMEMFYPRLIELFKSNIHSSVTVDEVRMDNYFHKVAKVYATLETIKTIANLSDPDKFPWSALPPFTAETPRPLRDLRIELKASPVEMNDFWSPVVQHLANFVLMPSVQDLISYRACSYFATEGSELIVIPSMLYWPDLPDTGNYAVDLRDHLMDELDELLDEYATEHSYLRLFTDWRARVDMNEMNFVGYDPDRDVAFRNSSHNSRLDILAAGLTNTDWSKFDLVVNKSINTDSFNIQSPTGEFSVKSALITKVLIDPDGLELLDSFSGNVHNMSCFRPMAIEVLSDDGNDIIYNNWDPETYPRFEADGSPSEDLSRMLLVEDVLNQRFQAAERNSYYNPITDVYDSYSPRNGACDGETVDVVVNRDAYIEMMKAAYDAVMDVNYINAMLGLVAGNALRTPSSPVRNLLGRNI